LGGCVWVTPGTCQGMRHASLPRHADAGWRHVPLRSRFANQHHIDSSFTIVSFRIVGVDEHEGCRFGRPEELGVGKYVITTAHFQLLARYNRIANERLYSACAYLNDAAYRKQRPGSFGSIHGLLNHILPGDRRWIGLFENRQRVTPPLDQG
jgi:hypothetical protein